MGIVFDYYYITCYNLINSKNMIWHKKYIVSLITWIGLGLIPTNAICQKLSTDSLLAKAFANDQLLPTLISSAQKFSPEVRRVSGGIALASANQRINKNALWTGLSFLSSYYYGTNYSAVSTQNIQNNLTTAQTGFYNVGVGFQLPITNVINRKHLLNSGQSLIEIAEAERDNSSLVVKQEVIKLYQTLKLSHKLLFLSRSIRQAAEINYKLSEKDFLQGQITVEQNSRVLDIFNKAKIDYETNLNSFQTGLMLLDAYTGVNFSTLLNQVK